jgi:hypothetical protein
MSCGFTRTFEAIQSAIDNAFAKGTLILAAAGNSGAIEECRWPASDQNVLGMAAAHGNGKNYDYNPRPNRNRQSFSILGCAVPGYLPSESKKNYRSGTSHATAVATAVAAIIMQVLRDCKDDIIKDKEYGREQYMYTENMLRTKSGMEKVFRQMVDEDHDSGGYYFVKPWTIVKGPADPQEKAKHIARELVGWCGINPWG